MKQQNIQNASANEKRRVKRAAVLKLGALLIFTVIVIVIGSLSWFSANRNVNVSNGGVKVGELGYELRFTGDNVGAWSYQPHTESVGGTVAYTTESIYDKVIPTDDPAYSLPDGVQNIEGYYDTGRSERIIMRMDWAYGTTEKETGLKPGDGNDLVFWIVPKKTGPLTVNLKLDILGYTAEQSEQAPFDVDSVTLIPSSVDTTKSEDEQAEQQKQINAVNFLRTHILFIWEEKNSSTDNWEHSEFMNTTMKNGMFIKNFEDATQGEPIEVHIRWDWTNTFQQMVLSGSESALPVTTNTEIRNAIRQYAYDNAATMFKDITAADAQARMTAPSGSTYEDTINANLDDLSRGYNRADSEIGKHIDYMLLVLTAE
ncbi:MAG: hypothetical protein IKO47_02855 [Ruminococcus sp.]|nr:hypothetical protein [Ruminococcus sp.]